MGTPIRIIHRINARNKDLISPNYCVIQYDSWLKTERYDAEQVVLLVSVFTSHQGVDIEVDLKYDVRDNVSDSLVFCYSKDNRARGKPLSESIYNQTLNLIGNFKTKNKYSKSVCQF